MIRVIINADDLGKSPEVNSAIDAFYRDYEPKSYSRNYYNFKENSFKKYYQNAHGSIIRGGVELTPNELEPIYAANPLVVFNAVYSGIHGFPTVTSPMSPSPYEIITNYRDGIINNINDYKKYGIDRARKNKYTMFHY